MGSITCLMAIQEEQEVLVGSLWMFLCINLLLEMNCSAFAREQKEETPVTFLLVSAYLLLKQVATEERITVLMEDGFIRTVLRNLRV